MNHPEVVDRLAILNAAHPRKLLAGAAPPGPAPQVLVLLLLRSPNCPRAVVQADNWHFFRHFLRDADRRTPRRRSSVTSRRGRSQGSKRDDQRLPVLGANGRPSVPKRQLRPIKAPTLIIWGQRDHYLGHELAEPEYDDVPNLDRVERLPDASHWVHHDEAERVTQLLTRFFARLRPS